LRRARKRGSLIFPSHPTTEIPSRFTSIPSARKAGAHGHAANRERDVWAHYHTNPVGDRTRVAEKLRSGTQFRAKSSKPGFRFPPGAALADLGGRPEVAASGSPRFEEQSWNLSEPTAPVLLLRCETPSSGHDRWRPRSCGKGNGAFFRLVKCTTSQPPWQAATGGTRHGERYQQCGRSARG